MVRDGARAPPHHEEFSHSQGEKNLMDIHLAGSRPTRRASSDWFTGTVWQDPINTPPAPARVNSARVAFEPGARTAWHTHPDAFCHFRRRTGADQGRPGPGNPPRRYGVDPA